MQPSSTVYNKVNIECSESFQKIPTSTSESNNYSKKTFKGIKDFKKHSSLLVFYSTW